MEVLRIMGLGGPEDQGAGGGPEDHGAGGGPEDHGVGGS